MPGEVTNIVIAGLGGQGVLKASDVLSDAVFRAGYDVKKSEIHGMSQRGGSVSSDVRYGEEVLSPMVPPHSADFLAVLEPDQVAPNQHRLREGGLLIDPSLLEGIKIPNRKSLNIVLLGVLSVFLEIPIEIWVEAVRANLPEHLHEVNLKSFEIGRETGDRLRSERLAAHS